MRWSNHVYINSTVYQNNHAPGLYFVVISCGHAWAYFTQILQGYDNRMSDATDKLFDM